MAMTEADIKAVVETAVKAVMAHAAELTALDQAIGDGDHGINMNRGFEAVLGELDAISAKPLPAALNAIGMQLVMSIGGASGPLYGTLFMALGKALPESSSLADLPAAFGAAIEALKARGKSDAGAKTMLDVLIPVQQALAAGSSLAELKVVAAEAAQATIPMQATRGRASFLGERSIGHMDPGARSSQILIEALCDAAEARA